MHTQAQTRCMHVTLVRKKHTQRQSSSTCRFSPQGPQHPGLGQARSQKLHPGLPRGAATHAAGPSSLLPRHASPKGDAVRVCEPGPPATSPCTRGPLPATGVTSGGGGLTSRHTGTSWTATATGPHTSPDRGAGLPLGEGHAHGSVYPPPCPLLVLPVLTLGKEPQEGHCPFSMWPGS